MMDCWKAGRAVVSTSLARPLVGLKGSEASIPVTSEEHSQVLKARLARGVCVWVLLRGTLHPGAARCGCS